MLSARPRVAELLLQLYGRNLHPELFEVVRSKRIERNGYTAAVHVTGAGHVIEWRRDVLVLTEVAASSCQPLPQLRRLMSHRLCGQRSDTLECRGGVSYEVSFALETATPEALASYQRELDMAGITEGLFHRFDSSGRIGLGAVSYIDLQSRDRSLRVRALHTFPDDGAVVKTQSVFRLPG